MERYDALSITVLRCPLMHPRLGLIHRRLRQTDGYYYPITPYCSTATTHGAAPLTHLHGCEYARTTGGIPMLYGMQPYSGRGREIPQKSYQVLRNILIFQWRSLQLLLK